MTKDNILNPNWNTKTLEEAESQGLLSLGRGKVISKIDLENIPGNYPVYSSSVKNNGLFGNYGEFMFDEELISWSVDGGGNFFYRPKHKYSVTNVTGYIRLKELEKIDYQFLFYALDYQHKFLEFDYVRKAHPSVIRPLYYVPDIDIKAQKIIAEVLSRLDQAISHTESLIAKYQRIKTGMMQDLLTRGIDENGVIRDPATHKFKPSPLGMIPEEWDIEYLTQNIAIPKGQVDPKEVPYLEWPLIAPDHIEQRTGCLLKIESAHEQRAISGKYVFHEGDVVYSKIRPYLRKAVLAEFRGICSADMYPMKPGPKITSEFLFLVVLSEHFSMFAESVSERSGFPKINRNELAEYIFALPKLKEQEMINEHISVIIRQMNTYQDKLKKLKRIKQGLLQDLLSGKVSVIPLI